MIHGFINYECITKNQKGIHDTGVMLVIVIITESKGKIGQRGSEIQITGEDSVSTLVLVSTCTVTPYTP